MRTLAFDGRTGASGDMLLGALLDAGADPAVLDPVSAALDVAFDVETVRRAGVTATAVQVRRPDGEPVEGGDEARAYEEVVAIVESMALPAPVGARALGAIGRLGRAEAAVHGTTLEAAHFHDVGADDAIADVTGVSLLIDDLDVERVVTTPVSAGGGEVSIRHGTFPVPTPAVVELAAGADWELRGGPVEGELLTPTGAALLAELADGVAALPAMRVRATGVGAGTTDLGDRPNVLRAVVGTSTGGLEPDRVTVLETALDDVTPEVLGHLHASLGAVGARDVTVQPTTMKKSRPGHLVRVVVRPEDAERVARRLAVETGTLGVREVGAGHRWIARRRFVTATLLEGGDRYPVAVKVGEDDAGVAYDVSAEFDEAAAVARETGLPVREVARRAEAAARDGGALDDVVLHVVEAADWAAVEVTYAPASLDARGFVPLSTADRVLGVAAYHLPDAEEPVLLAVDREAVEADLRYEEGSWGAFPHLYAPLPTGAVVDVHPLPRDAAGRYRRPEALGG